MVNKEFFAALTDLVKEKGISEEAFIATLENALASAYKKQFEGGAEVFVDLDPEKGTISFKAVRYVVEEVEDEVRWDFKWDSRFTGYDTRSMTHTNEGHVEAPIEVEIDGHVVDPYIELYVEGELVQTVTFDVEIDEYEKLLYNTKMLSIRF